MGHPNKDVQANRSSTDHPDEAEAFRRSGPVGPTFPARVPGRIRSTRYGDLHQSNSELTFTASLIKILQEVPEGNDEI